jgi:hypothetical protein
MLHLAIKLKEPTLLAFDKEIAKAIWGDDKTISCHLGELEMLVPPDETAVRICAVLNKWLGPDHCKNAMINEGG